MADNQTTAGKLLAAENGGTEVIVRDSDGAVFVRQDVAECVIERLRATLREIRRDIEEAADDVVWMRGGIETVHDRITAVLGDDEQP